LGSKQVHRYHRAGRRFPADCPADAATGPQTGRSRAPSAGHFPGRGGIRCGLSRFGGTHELPSPSIRPIWWPNFP